jgi:hypothetical protein
MDRRAFLRALGFGTVVAAAAATSVLDLERLLWVPGEKTIFLPTARHDMFTPEWVSQEWLRVLKHQLAFSTHINREYDAKFQGLVTAQAHTIEVRLPSRFHAVHA